MLSELLKEWFDQCQHNLLFCQNFNRIGTVSRSFFSSSFFWGGGGVGGFTAISRIFHLYWADRSSKVGENWRTWGKNHLTICKQNSAFPHWPEWGSNTSGEKPNGLRVNSPIYQDTGARNSIKIWYPNILGKYGFYLIYLFKIFIYFFLHILGSFTQIRTVIQKHSVWHDIKKTYICNLIFCSNQPVLH